MSTTNTPTSKTIEITVSPEGATSIKTAGFTGSSCRDATRDLERALGVAARESLLPEFYVQGQTQSGEQLRQGQ
jgi:hypothetical protein